MSEIIPSAANPSLGEASKEQLLEIIKGMASMMANPTPKIRNNLTNPAGPRVRRTIHPYYKERFALGLKPILDEILADSQPRALIYTDFPNYSHNTLWARIHWSWEYINDHLDPEKKYTNLRKICELKKQKQGIFIVPREELQIARLYARKITEGENAGNEWKIKLDNFLEDGEVNTKLTLDNLALSEEDQLEVKLLLHGAIGILGSVTEDSIKVIKYDPENPPDIIKQIQRQNEEPNSQNVRGDGG